MGVSQVRLQSFYEERDAQLRRGLLRPPTPEHDKERMPGAPGAADPLDGADTDLGGVCFNEEGVREDVEEGESGLHDAGDPLRAPDIVIHGVPSRSASHPLEDLFSQPVYPGLDRALGGGVIHRGVSL